MMRKTVTRTEVQAAVDDLRALADRWESIASSGSQTRQVESMYAAPRRRYPRHPRPAGGAMTSARRPEPLQSWRIEAHCRHCDWQTVRYINRVVAQFASHDQALEYIKQHPHGPDRRQEA